MSTRTRRRSPRKRKRESSSEEKEESSSSSSEQSPPPKKQKKNNKKSTKNGKKAKKNIKKKKEEDDGYIYIVQGRLQGCDQDETEFDSEDGDPAGFDTVTYNAYKSKVKANQAAIAVYKKNTKKKHQKISTRHDYQNGLFNKISPFFTKRNMPDEWGGFKYHAWVLQKQILD